MCLQDSESLKRFLLKEDIKELPSEEEVWEVPEPTRPDNALERGTGGKQSVFPHTAHTSPTSSLHLSKTIITNARSIVSMKSSFW